MRDVNLRQTGRTTKMLIEAHDAKVLGERVLIISPNSDITRSLMRIARELGIMDGGVQPRPLTKHDFTSTHHIMHGKLRGYRGALFEDHTVQEFSPPLQYVREIDAWHNVSVPKPEPVASATPRWSFTSF